MPFDKNVLMLKLLPNPSFIRNWGEVMYEHLPIRRSVKETEDDWFWAHFDGDDPNDESFFGLNSSLTGLWQPRPPTLEYEHLEFLMPVGRIPLVASINFLVPLFCVVSLAGTGYAFDVSDLPDRLAVVLTMLLTAIAFRLAINESLPSIDHLTLLDKYILASYLLLSFAASEMTVAYRFHKTAAAATTTTTAAAAAGVNTNAAAAACRPSSGAAAPGSLEQSPPGGSGWAEALDAAAFRAVAAAWLLANLILLLAYLCPGSLSDSWDGAAARHAARRHIAAARYQKMRFPSPPPPSPAPPAAAVAGTVPSDGDS